MKKLNYFLRRHNVGLLSFPNNYFVRRNYDNRAMLNDKEYCIG